MKLSSCPFCGSKAKIREVLVAWQSLQYWIGCFECGLFIKCEESSKENVIKLWNTRK